MSYRICGKPTIHLFPRTARTLSGQVRGFISCCPRSFSTDAAVTLRTCFRYKCFAKTDPCTPQCPGEANVGPDLASRPHEPGGSPASRSRRKANGDSGKTGNRLDCLPGPEGAARGVSAEQATTTRKALFGSRDSGRRESGAGASTLQAQGTAIRALLGAAQTPLLREAERPAQAEEGSRHPPRTAASEADLVSPLRRAHLSPEPARERAAAVPPATAAADVAVSRSSRRTPSPSCARTCPAPQGA